MDHAIIRDRSVLNPGALNYWLFHHFKLNIFCDADAERVPDIDPLLEKITVDGEDYLIPHWAYLSLGMEPSDERPLSWQGIPRHSVIRA